MGSVAQNDQEAHRALKELSKERLVELVQIYAKSIIAIDGVWFQSIESTEGMDTAMFHDREAWKRFTVSEARRIKKFLGLSEHSGLKGLAEALEFKATSVSNVYSMQHTNDTLVFRIEECRVQSARAQKDMPYHPCKSVGEVEYAGFARTIDERIQCECLSCFPEVTDESCSCAWKFTLANLD